MTATKTSFERSLIPIVLTVVALGIGAMLGALFGVGILVLYLSMAALPLLLLWVSADVESADERLGRALERAPRTAPPAPPAPIPTSRTAEAGASAE